MRFQDDGYAASPLVVITTFVVGAAVATAVTYALFFDRPEPRLQFVEAEGEDGRAFDVSHAGGGLDWDDVTLRLLDRAGVDQARAFLHPPTGVVERGDRVEVDPDPPAGTYLLLALRGGAELSRLAVEF